MKNGLKSTLVFPFIDFETFFQQLCNDLSTGVTLFTSHPSIQIDCHTT